MRKTELLVPASSLEVLKIAVVFGADAVFIGGEAFGFVQRRRTIQKKIWQKELLLHMNMV